MVGVKKIMATPETIAKSELTWTQLFGATAAGLASSTVGVNMVYAAVAIPQFRRSAELNMDLEKCSWFGMNRVLNVDFPI